MLGAVVAPQRKCAPSWWVFSTQCPGAPCSQSSVSVRSAFWCRDFLSFFLVFVRPDPVSPAADVAETISVDFVFHFSSFSDRFLSSVAVCFGLFEAYSAVGMQLRCKKKQLVNKNGHINASTRGVGRVLPQLPLSVPVVPFLPFCLLGPCSGFNKFALTFHCRISC